MNDESGRLMPILTAGTWTLEQAIEGVGACSLCHGPLVICGEEAVTCAACKTTFPIQHGIPCMEVGSRSEALSREIKWYGEDNEDEAARPTQLSEGHHLAHTKARAAIVQGLQGLGASDSWTILSVACGDGYEIPLIEQVSRRIVGIDLALVALRRFKARFPYPVFQGNVRALPFRDLAFDACVVSGLVHHIIGYDDLAPYLVEFRRVLRPGGALVTVEPNSLYPIQWVLGPINRVVQRMRPGWRGLVPHERPLSPGFIQRSIRDAGYCDLRYTGTTSFTTGCLDRFAELWTRWRIGSAPKPLLAFSRGG